LHFAELIEHLDAALRHPLPGPAAQALMAPTARRPHTGAGRDGALRDAAGLLLLVPSPGVGAHVVLTVRSRAVGRHRGQVSLPGGVMDDGETAEQAAFREAREEIGLSAGSVRTIGALSPLDIAVSGFRLYPILAVAVSRLQFQPAGTEVHRIIEASIPELLDGTCIVWRRGTRDGQAITFPAFVVDGEEIWGATAMVLAEFLALLGWRGPKP
jgi:8-oxo-dGTP pyrophosphatase MutT (NUDIX family)